MSVRVISDIVYGRLFDAKDPTVGAQGGPFSGAWRLTRAARDADVVFTNEGKRTPLGLVLLAGLLWATAQRKLILSEFLPGTRSGVKGAVVTAAYRFLIPKVLLAAQVMTEWERDEYAARYRIPIERLHLVPFYYYDDRVVDDPPPWCGTGRTGILSTGKNACDWDTVIAAAKNEAWPLTLVSRLHEWEQIREAAYDAGVDALHDVPRAQHDRMLANSALLIVALKEKSVSAGHVRLMTAATFGTPVVLTGIKGVRGYEDLAVMVVPHSDPEALREGVNSLLANPERLGDRMESVRAFARQRPYSLYVSDIRKMLTRAVN